MVVFGREQALSGPNILHFLIDDVRSGGRAQEDLAGELDYIPIYDSAAAVPEPTVGLPMLIGFLLLLKRRQ